MSQVLTLANGDRILMTGQMKAFFEPENLNNASPATVSRAGIIYVSDTELGWQPMVASWLKVCPGPWHMIITFLWVKQFKSRLKGRMKLECAQILMEASGA